MPFARNKSESAIIKLRSAIVDLGVYTVHIIMYSTNFLLFFPTPCSNNFFHVARQIIRIKGIYGYVESAYIYFVKNFQSDRLWHIKENQSEHVGHMLLVYFKSCRSAKSARVVRCMELML